MIIFGHLLILLLSSAVIWFFAGLLIDSVDRVAKRFHQTGFTVAFFVLGFLTSISEISVMVNSTITKTPQISAGNLAGASFIILLLIIPFLAIANNGIRLKNTFNKTQLLLSLILVSLPVLLLLDGNLRFAEGLICVMAYATLLYLIRGQSAATVPEVISEVGEELINKTRATAKDIAKIAGGGLFIFLAGQLLVREAIFFSGALGVPSSIIGLILLSIGTNVPELVIAIRSIYQKRSDIAFGDYLGSAVTNVPVFGMLGILNGHFAVERSEFILTAILTIIGLFLFYKFAISKNTISRKEGFVLISISGLFILVQFINLIRFAAT